MFRKLADPFLLCAENQLRNHVCLGTPLVCKKIMACN